MNQQAHEYHPVHVGVAREIAERFQKDIVVIVSYDRQYNLVHTTTFGREPADKDIAAAWGDICVEATGADTSNPTWYEDFRATKEAEYKARIDQLTAERDAALERLHSAPEVLQ